MRCLCSNCNKYKILDFNVPHSKERLYICKQCAKKIKICNICYKITNDIKEIVVNMQIKEKMCENCLSKRYYLCKKCGSYHYIGEDCPDIWRYDMKPILKFIGEGTRHYGIELEISNRESLESDKRKKAYAAEVIEIFGHNFYIKHDGSVSNGFEVVSHPMTRKKIFDYFTEEKFKKLKDLGFRKHSSCGLHMHITRTSIDRKALLRIFKFIRAHSSKIFSITKRGSSAISNYCTPINDINLIEEYTKKNNYVHNTEKYTAVRLTNSTVEFRFMNGEIEYKRFRASVEFMFAILDFCEITLYPEVINKEKFNSFLKSSRQYEYAYDVLKEI